MRDLDDRFVALSRTRPPELWPDIEGRQPRARPPIVDGRARLAAATVALTVAAAATLVTIRAFQAPPTPSSRERQVADGRIPTLEVRGFERSRGVAEFPNAVVVGEGGIWVSAPANDGSGAGDVVRLDPSTGDVVARIPVAALPTWEVGGGGMATGLGSVWVAGTEFGPGPAKDRGVVTQIDPSTNLVVGTIDVGPGSQGDVWADGSGIWVLLFTDDERYGLAVARLDPSTHEVLAHIPIDGIWSQEIAVEDGAVWVNARQAHPDDEDSVGADTLVRIDIARDTISWTRPNTAFVPSSSTDDGTIWTRVHEGLLALDAATGRPLGDPVSMPSSFRPFFVDPPTGVWAYGFSGELGSWALARVDPATAAADPIVELGPDTKDNDWWIVAAALDPATTSAWVVHHQDAVTRVAFRRS